MSTRSNSSRYVRNTDLLLLFLAIVSSVYGLILINSATLSYETDRYVTVQGFAILLGIVLYIVVSIVDIEAFAIHWKIIFFVNLIFQISVLFFGKDVNGNRSWLEFGALSLQPVEVGKVIFIFTLAAHIASVYNRINEFKTIFALSLHLGVTFVIIMIASGDAGSAIAYIVIFVIMIFVAGLSVKWFIGAGILGISAVPFVWNFVLEEYQKTRILVLFDPSIDPDKAYQTTQSKIAIGAGEVYGSGYMQGNQTQYSMLPEKHNDFIFSVAAEELGFIGAVIIIVLLSAIILRLFFISFKANSMFSSMLIIGLAGMFLFQMIENIFMCLGFLPVMGLTLPFFSYGGSSIITMFTALGIAAGSRMREKPDWLDN